MLIPDGQRPLGGGGPGPGELAVKFDLTRSRD